MSTRRKFNFPFATLTLNAGLLSGALADSAYQAAMSTRLGAPFMTAFPLKVTELSGGTAAQSSQTGDLSQLTARQQADFQEMERLTAGARRTARLAFPGQDTVLGAEFQVGEAGSKSLAATIGRARLTHAAAEKYATELQTKGWIPADTSALGTAIAALAQIAPAQEEAEDDRLGLTNEKIIDANDLYADCLVIQNAARLQYPGGTDAAGNARNVTERARFLLDEFPPRDREKPAAAPQAPTPPPAP